MEFLDIPLVRAILMGAAFGALVSWLFGRYVKGFGNAKSPDIEKMIDQLSDSDLSEIRVALDGNRKLEAIKYFRASTNAGLREAKIVVERLIEQKRMRHKLTSLFQRSFFYCWSLCPRCCRSARLNPQNQSNGWFEPLVDTFKVLLNRNLGQLRAFF